MDDTIFALSSRAPPAGVAVVRLSGKDVRFALERLVDSVPEPRKVSLRFIKRGDDDVLDQGLVIYFPAPASFTGEDVAELHLHGGRAVVAGVLDALAQIDGLRPAEAGEFTRRAFLNRRIDLTEAEGLADMGELHALTSQPDAKLLEPIAVRAQVGLEKLLVVSQGR